MRKTENAFRRKSSLHLSLPKRRSFGFVCISYESQPSSSLASGLNLQTHSASEGPLMQQVQVIGRISVRSPSSEKIWQCSDLDYKIFTLAVVQLHQHYSLNNVVIFSAHLISNRLGSNKHVHDYQKSGVRLIKDAGNTIKLPLLSWKCGELSYQLLEARLLPPERCCKLSYSNMAEVVSAVSVTNKTVSEADKKTSTPAKSRCPECVWCMCDAYFHQVNSSSHDVTVIGKRFYQLHTHARPCLVVASPTDPFSRKLCWGRASQMFGNV